MSLRRRLLGMQFTDGLIYKGIVVLLLISFSYIYLYPMLFMLTNSFMNVEDLINPGVKWIPTVVEIENYRRAIEVLELPSAIFSSTSYVLRVSLSATISSALIGYGFGTFNFPLKKLLFALMLATFILPSQVTMVANMLIFRNLGIMSTQQSMILPAIFGQGYNAAIYILIFYQFFSLGVSLSELDFRIGGLYYSLILCDFAQSFGFSWRIAWNLTDLEV